jgi:hypothetical protein
MVDAFGWSALALVVRLLFGLHVQHPLPLPSSKRTSFHVLPVTASTTAPKTL